MPSGDGSGAAFPDARLRLRRLAAALGFFVSGPAALAGPPAFQPPPNLHQLPLIHRERLWHA
jgi:hypothetical protein